MSSSSPSSFQYYFDGSDDNRGESNFAVPSSDEFLDIDQEYWLQEEEDDHHNQAPLGDHDGSAALIGSASLMNPAASAEMMIRNYTDIGGSSGSRGVDLDSSTNNKKSGNGGEKKEEGTNRVAFRTKSDLEILDDGFKWRKYGRKMVKSSPNPRNYYRCSIDGCPVKKRVERDGDDPMYVITTYEGVHDHESFSH